MMKCIDDGLWMYYVRTADRLSNLFVVNIPCVWVWSVRFVNKIDGWMDEWRRGGLGKKKDVSGICFTGEGEWEFGRELGWDGMDWNGMGMKKSYIMNEGL